MKIVLATGNPGKVRELASQLAGAGIEVLPQSDFCDDEAVEDGDTFVENALKKARHAARASGLGAVADDSGLRVDALGGAPGVCSARYAGKRASDRDNWAKLLADMAELTMEQRGAAFHCTLVFLRNADDPAPIIASAEWPGRILSEARGEGGFGYDPVFQPDGMPCSAAELTPAEKQASSHRARALAHFLPQLRRVAAG